MDNEALIKEDFDNTPQKNNKMAKIFSSRKTAYLLIFILIALISTVIHFLPSSQIPEKGINLRTIRVKGYPLTLILEEQEGIVTSCWLRTPAGSKEIKNMDGMTFISETTFIAKVDQDEEDDLLWRLSFINFNGEGVHLWLGLTTFNPKVFISVTPYNYTRWDTVPAKVIVPKGTALYISPGVPLYDNVKEQYKGADSYSFIYTIRLTPDGPAFVPLPSVYKQLGILLRTSIRGELSTMKRLAYVRMLSEFNNLAEGRPPGIETILNLQMQKIDTLRWEK